MRGHIAQKNGRYYPVISIKDQGTGTWKRKWLGGNTTKRKKTGCNDKTDSTLSLFGDE